MRRTMGGASGRILEVAAERFATNGYRGTSIEEIAAGAEISRSSLFWHFGSKEGLLRAVIGDTLQGWADVVADAASTDRGLAALRAAVTAMNTVRTENPSMVRLMSLLMGEASATEEALVPIFVEVEQSMLGLWRRWLSEAAEDGELRPGVDPEKAAGVLNAASFGTSQLWALSPEHHSVSDMEQAFLHVIDCLSVSGPELATAGRRRSSRAKAGQGAPATRRLSEPRKAASK